MQALLFEVEPRAGHEDHYFEHAARLRPLLEAHTGLLFIDRFKSLARPNIILSHSQWRDEAALAKWRTDPQHNASQRAGRNEHFKDYRIRISHVLTNYMRGQSPTRWTREGVYNDDPSRPARFLTIVATEGGPFPDGGEGFRSVNFDNAYLSVRASETEADGEALIATARQSADVTNAMFALVSRDYGMFERDEAPQYFPQARLPA